MTALSEWRRNHRRKKWIKERSKVKVSQYEYLLDTGYHTPSQAIELIVTDVMRKRGMIELAHWAGRFGRGK